MFFEGVTIQPIRRLRESLWETFLPDKAMALGRAPDPASLVEPITGRGDARCCAQLWPPRRDVSHRGWQ